MCRHTRGGLVRAATRSAEGIGIENAEAEEALRRQHAGELIDTSSAVSFATDASEGYDEDDLIEDEEEPPEVDYDKAPEEDLEALASAEEDDTPPSEDYRPRH